MENIQSNCPICHVTLSLDKQKNNIDYYFCNADIDNHYYGHTQNGEVMVNLKIRLQESKDNALYLKLYYLDEYLEVWTKKNDDKVIKINHTFVPDFSDLEKVKSKIKTFFLFS